MSDRPGNDVTMLSLGLWFGLLVGGVFGWPDVIQAACLVGASVTYAIGRLCYQIEQAR